MVDVSGDRIEIGDVVTGGVLVTSAFPDTWDPSRLKAILAQSPTPTWVVDAGAGRVFANAATAELFHIDPEDLSVVGGDGMSLLHPNERERTTAEIRGILTGELDGVRRVKHFLRPDGTDFYGQLESRPLKDARGQTWAILSVCRDITRQREAERALVHREAWFEALVRHNVDAIVVLSPDAVLTYASPSAEDLLGYKVSDWMGRDALELVHPDDIAIVAESFANTAATPGTAIPLRFRLMRSDGQLRLVEAVATNLIDDPAVRGVVVNLRDLTESHEVASALEVSENRFRKMLENISDTVTLVDSTGQVIRTTGNVKSILGYPTEFWSERNAFDIAHPDDLDRIRQILVALLETPGREMTGEFRVRHANGHYEHVEASAVNLLDDPEVAAIVMTTRNITGRKVAERELSQARDQALRALEVRNEFVASVSHELRTPIHGILGLAELLATSAEASGEIEQLALSIRRATDSLRLVLDDILDFTKIEAGRLELNEQPIALREVMDDLVVLFGPQASAKGIALQVRADDALPASLVADGLRLRQVLNNLVSNAVKFTSYGAVMVELSCSPHTADELRVVVSDTGIGMSPDVVDRVFEPFSQAHAHTAREYGGTGLGLTIARRLIDMMGGTLTVDTELGRGTTFALSLPLRSRVDGDSADDDSIAATARVGHGRVMVVEDNAVNQLLVGRQLERLGYEPVVASSGEEAIEMLARDPVDAVLMDWQMPGIDGLETSRRLRGSEGAFGKDRVPIVAMTASAMPGDRELCLEAGMDDFMIKPVNLSTLGRTLATWLNPSDEPAGDDSAAVAGLPRDGHPVDGSVLDRLLDELDDPALVATVIATYRRELPVRVEGIEDAARAGDMPNLRALAHTLKSTSAALGAEHLARLCLQLEDLARSDVQPSGSLEPFLARLSNEQRRVDGALDSEGRRFGSLARVSP